jgi:HSP20 family molecular chaperone IbpA
MKTPILLTLLFLILKGPSAAAQSHPTQDSFERRRQMHQQLHERIRDRVLQGFGGLAADDLFKDFEEFFNDDLLKSSPWDQGLGAGASKLQTEWKEDKSERVLVITPQDEGQELDISVQGSSITITGKTKKQNEFGTSVSSFTNSFPVPADCDTEKVKIEQQHKKILVRFPRRAEGRTPVAPSKQDIAI